jgi:hypothetical protein
MSAMHMRVNAVHASLNAMTKQFDGFDDPDTEEDDNLQELVVDESEEYQQDLLAEAKARRVSLAESRARLMAFDESMARVISSIDNVQHKSMQALLEEEEMIARTQETREMIVRMIEEEERFWEDLVGPTDLQEAVINFYEPDAGDKWLSQVQTYREASEYIAQQGLILCLRKWKKTTRVDLQPFGKRYRIEDVGENARSRTVSLYYRSHDSVIRRKEIRIPLDADRVPANIKVRCPESRCGHVQILQ